MTDKNQDENNSFTSPSSQTGNSKWLDALYNPVASLYTFTQCLTLCDITGDGESKLIIADLGTGMLDMKLKVFRGTVLVSENTIIDLPTGVVTFYMDTNEPRVPAIAVASGPHIFIYKNLRPYFKFTLPPLDINPIEQDLWNQAKEEKIDVTVLREMLDGIRNEGAPLTPRSLKLLQVEPHDLESFASLHKYTPLKRQTVVTCLAKMNKTHIEEDALSCLILGTEHNSIFVLDPEAFTVLATMSLPSVPVFLSVSGLFDVEYRIYAACRNGCIYSIKRGAKSGKLVMELNSQPVGLERQGKNLIVGCMDDTLNCFSAKGKKLWSFKLPGAITSMGNMDYKPKNLKAVLVALSTNVVNIYQDKFLVDSIAVEDTVMGMSFGQFGREDGSLILITKGGGLIVKILKRTGKFEMKDMSAGPPLAQNMKLSIPKKTKLFVDQTMRERENCVAMHRAFQHDLSRIRLGTAKNYLKALETSSNPISSSATEPIKLSAQVQGIGPVFKLSVNLQNTSFSTPSMNLIITFHYDDKLYRIRRGFLSAPMLVPGLNYSFDTYVECLSDKGLSDIIKVFVLHQGNSIPIVTAVINMPVSETMVVV